MTDLLKRCVEFVTEQSEGEWGDTLIMKDAVKMQNFIVREIDAAQSRIAELESAAEKTAEYVARLKDLLRAARRDYVSAIDGYTHTASFSPDYAERKAAMLGRDHATACAFMIDEALKAGETA